jgi:putative membrane protein
MIRGLRLFTGIALLFGALAVRADEDKKPPEKPFEDGEFVKTVARSGLLEVELGKVAAKAAKRAEVKAFAEMMVTDHAKVKEELKKAAESAGLPVPEMMGDERQKTLDRFAKYTGKDFDRDYATEMIAQHEKDVALFTTATKAAKHPAVKDFAKKTLPTIQAHLEAAKKLQPKD